MKQINTESEIKNVYNLIILDESGSMHSIYMPALSGVNETLQTIRTANKEHKDQRHFVSLVTFNTESYNVIYKTALAEKTSDITNKQYCPNGGTPLYDAMAKSINDLRSVVSESDMVLVTIITDGYENASREYNGKAIKVLVENMKNIGWVFTYIGANQDVEAVASSLSINNHLHFDADLEGTREMFAKESKSRKSFFSRISLNISHDKLADNYFED